MADIGAGDDKAIGVNRITRVRHQHRVALVDGGQRQVRQTFLGTDGDNRLLFRIQRDAVAALIPGADRLAQARDALRYRIAMGVVAPRGLDHLVDDMRGCGLVGIAHAEVDNIFTALARLRLQLVDDVEDVGRKPLDAGGIGLSVHRFVPPAGCPDG